MTTTTRAMSENYKAQIEERLKRLEEEQQQQFEALSGRVEEVNAAGGQSEDLINRMARLEVKQQVENERAKIPIFTGRDSISVNPRIWLDKFECYGDLHQWDDQRKVKAFRLYLGGAAELWYAGLGDAQKATFDALKQTFIDYFVTSRPKYAMEQELMNTDQRPGQTVDDFAADIQSKCSLLGKSDEDRRTYFVRGLLPELKAFVIARDCTTYEDALKTARLGATVVKIQKSGNSSDKELNHRIVNLLERQSDEIEKLRSGATTQASRRPPTPYPRDRGFQQRKFGTNPGRTTNGKIRCYRCGMLGHVASTCRVTDNSNKNFRYSRQSIICHGCKRRGHMIRDCKALKNKSEN